MRVVFSILVLITIFWGCQSKDVQSDFQENYYNIIIPQGFDSIPFPEEKPTFTQIELGRKLFFDKSLSLDKSISCANCHKPKYAFADTIKFSLGVNDSVGFRNAPTLTNVVYNSIYLMDGGVPTLETQAVIPIEDHLEMNIPIVELVKRLSESVEYSKLSREAFGREIDPYVITRALAAFQRTLISGDSKYDKFVNGDRKIFSEKEKKGFKLFTSLNCIECHSGFNFSNYTFQNNGLIALGDTGRARVTLKKEDVGKFKVPTLRNVGLTAPYMHDGRMSNIQEVIEHYNVGGDSSRNKSDLIQPLGLTVEQKENLILFLHTLTDSNFVHKIYN